MSTVSSVQRPRALRPARAGVPWATVGTLAGALSCAAAFWLVSLEGAIGATERFRTPFATWLMLSLVLLPVFGFAVLGVLVLALRWFGAGELGTRKVVVIGAMLVMAGTLAGLATIVASSAYDYSLQLRHINGMSGMAPCTGSCVPREQHEILVLHLNGVLLVGRRLLLSNAIIVGWLLAMWGGQVKLVSSRAGRSDDSSPAGSTLADDVRRLLIGALVGAAVIHAAVISEHLQEWPAAGIFFMALTTAELVAAIALMVGWGGRWILLGIAAGSGLPLVLWCWSRTAGLPFGPEPGVAEAVGVPDVLACVLELLALVLVLALLAPARLPQRPVSAHGRGLAALAILAVVVIGLVATGPRWFDAFGVSATQSGMEMSE